VETIDFGLNAKDLYAVGLKGTLEDFSSDDLHVHPFHQVLQIRNGVALLQEKDGKRPQYGHMAAFIPAYAPHRTEVLGQSVGYQSLYFNRALFRRQSGAIVIFRMSALGMALLDYLNREDSLADGSRGVFRDCVRLFVKILSVDVQSDVGPLLLPEPTDRMNRAVSRFIERRYQERITSKDFERAFPLSFRQLSRRFKSDLGLSVFEYLRVFRMLRASIYINTTDMKILSVAYECGYESISSFFSDFKKVFGLSPAEFRSRHS